MAIYNLDNYLDKDGLGFPLNFRRGNPNPLDNSSVHAVYTDAVTYASTDPTAYVGQVLTVVYADAEKTEINPTVYVIKDEAGTLEPVGVIPLGDDKTVVVDEDGTISLVGIADITDTTKKYQPVLIDGKLTWQELSATTVEGLDASIKAVEGEVETLKTDLDTAEEKIAALGTAVGDAESGLVKDVAANTEAISKNTEDIAKNAEDIAKNTEDITAVTEQANTNKTDIATLKETTTDHGTRLGAAETAIADRYTKEETAAKIAEEIGKQAHFSAKIVTSTDEMTDTTTLYLIKKDDVTGSDVYEEYMVIDGAPVIIGETSTDLSDYATLEALNNGLAEKAALVDFNNLSDTVDGILERLEAAETTIGEHTTAIEELNTAVSTKAEASALDNYVTKETYEPAVEEINTELGKKALASDLEALTQTVGSNKTAADEAIEALQGADSGLSDRIGALEEVGSEKNVIAAVSSEFNVTDDTRTLSIVAVDKDKVIGLAEALAGKVDAIEGYTLLSPDDASKLKALVLGDSGKVEISGKVNASNVEELDTWIINNRDTLGGLFSTVDSNKLTNIEAGAQVNIIEAIQLAGTALSVTDKTVNIPLATDALAGLIKSAVNTAEGATVANAVYVNANTGVGEVKAVNVNTLVQDDGDTLILNGGSASTGNS